MKKVLSTIFLLIILCIPTYTIAQSVANIKSNPNNIWSEGSATTLEKAKKNALDMLLDQISTQVENNYKSILSDDKNTPQNNTLYSSKVNTIIKTFSGSAINNVEMLVVSEEPEAKVFLYINKTDLSKIFISRKQKIIEYTDLAFKYETKLQIGDALRLYYWSLLLLKSHPDCNTIKYLPQNETKELNLISWLPEHINSILKNIQFSTSSIKKEEIISTFLLDIKYKNQPVTNLDFKYWDGRNYTQTQNVNNGKSSVEIQNVSSTLNEKLKIRVEYMYEYQARIDKELESIFDKIDPIGFDKNNYIVELKPSSEKNKPLNIETTPKPIVSDSIPGKIDEHPYQLVIDKILLAIRTKDYSSVQNYFNTDAYESFNSLVKMGNARVIGTPVIKAFSFEGNVICRSVPMLFTFSNNNRKFTEDVVFHFNKEMKITNIAFGLGKSAVSSIISNTQYSERDKLTIINFLENYKTAFALKRIDYIESIFADDALIIVGKYVKTAQNIESPYANNKIVKYNRMSKQTYIRNLRQAFHSNEFINLQFEDSYIEKAAKGGDIYGIEIKQNYFSSSYGDQGYLFLGVDLNDQPIIFIRAWQPEKRSDGKTIKISDF